MQSRRQFVQQVGMLGAATLLSRLFQEEELKDLPLACQQYTWTTFLRRDGSSWEANYDAAFQAFVQSGLKGIEFSFPDAATVAQMKPYFERYGLWQRSAYTNAWLHEEAKVEETIKTVVDMAQAAKSLGVEILVVNPTPIRWGGTEDKNDAQLHVQRDALEALARQLKAQGQTLAYHTHDAEMRAGAREFHHMLRATDPDLVKLCLDAHWIYRGAGNSQIALWDIVEMYGERIVELHLRQSIDGIWTETFAQGDIDHDKLLRYLLDHNLQPHLVLEQCVETGTPNTMSAIEAHRQSQQNIQQQFAAL